MAAHDSKERRLITDICEKNRLAGEFRRRSYDVRRWRDRLEQKRGKRWQAQYRGSIERASMRLEAVRDELLAQAEVLRSSIEAEQKVSESEIDAFQKQYAKEVKELAEAQAQLAEARKALAKAETRPPAVSGNSDEIAEAAAVLTELRHKHWLVGQAFEREAREKAKAAQEISSEEKDKVLLSYELRRAIAEIEALRDASV